MKYKINKDFSIEANSGTVFDIDILMKSLIEKGDIVEIAPIEFVDESNPKMLDGRYICQYNTKSELRYCLTKLGIKFGDNETAAQLKKRRDDYLKDVKNK